MSNYIFNYQKLRAHKIRAKNTINDSPFFTYVNNDIIERLNIIDKKFHKIINLGYSTNYLTTLLNNTGAVQTLDFDEEFLPPQKDQFDLIVFCFGLHWVNDIPRFLKYVHDALAMDGIFIANFIGANSLKNLRNKFTELESKLGHPHYPHISPFMQLSHVSPLVSQAGFSEMIVDFEMIDLEYKNPILLMKAIKAIGESNKLSKAPGYTISKDMMKSFTNYSSFSDQVNLISFIAAKNKGTIKISLVNN